jgi:hypothetical protein
MPGNPRAQCAGSTDRIHGGEVEIMRPGLISGPAWLLLVFGAMGAGKEGPADEVTVLDDRFMTRTAPILLLARPDVQTDLRLDHSQVAGAKRTIARLLELGLRLKNASGPAAVAGRAAIDQEMRHWLGANLNDGQRERLHQIALQWEGPTALAERPLVVEYLNMTDEQRQTVARIVAESQRRRAQGALTPSDLADLSRRALAVLSRGQQVRWEHLLGPPCHFSLVAQAGPPGQPSNHGDGVPSRQPAR